MPRRKMTSAPHPAAVSAAGGPRRIEYRRVTLEFMEPLFGLTPSYAKVWEDWIKPAQQKAAAKAGQDIAAAQEEEQAVLKVNTMFLDKGAARERAAADAAAAKDPDFVAEEHPSQITTFAADEHGPFLWSYQIHGHLKEIGNLAKEALGITNLRKKIENAVVILPRRIYIDGTLTEPVRRPLRANTPQGMVVAIAESHAIMAGGRITFWIGLLPNAAQELTWEVIRELLDWGEIRGLGQWRTAGWGTYEVVEWAEETERPPRYVKPVQGVPAQAFEPLRWG